MSQQLQACFTLSSFSSLTFWKLLWDREKCTYSKCSLNGMSHCYLQETGELTVDSGQWTEINPWCVNGYEEPQLALSSLWSLQHITYLLTLKYLGSVDLSNILPEVNLNVGWENYITVSRAKQLQTAPRRMPIFYWLCSVKGWSNTE